MFQGVEGEGMDKGVVVSDVLLPASGLPFAILLGVVLTYNFPKEISSRKSRMRVLTLSRPLSGIERSMAVSSGVNEMMIV